MHLKIRAFLLCLIFTAFSANFVCAQEEDDDWYWDRPISKITFKGLQSVKQSELSGLVSSYIGRNVGDCFYDLLNRLEALN